MELIYIFLQTLLMLTIFSIGYPILSKYKNNVNSTNFINQLIFNSVIHINFILFLTFSKFDNFPLLKLSSTVT